MITFETLYGAKSLVEKQNKFAFNIDETASVDKAYIVAINRTTRERFYSGHVNLNQALEFINSFMDEDKSSQFPRYTEVLELVVKQVISNHLYENINEPGTQAQIHGEVAGVLNILLKDTNFKLDVTYSSFKVDFDLELDLSEKLFVRYSFYWG
ncbi:Hypothetical protein KNT65_gp209 [Escherichia phage EcS1]|uniref:DUF7355 domain-containing protein n=1 Tax=Escherichia phage EcS1 TaxID=2083276 RepID=A0A2Z5ZCT3_9CAUD|nr:Hypothetical protein KNT65_gp209 [Escherichia phage EcS1]BBC78284.1 Hypothetical protein [Escherichia phage EcS1]